MRPAKMYPGSRRRVRNIRMRGNGSPAFYWFVALMAVVLLFIAFRFLT